MHFKKKLLVAAMLVGLAHASGAQQRLSLQDAASRAVLTNPEVLAKMHAFDAAGFERSVAFGGYLPTGDIVAGIARERLDDPLVTTAPRFTQRNVSFILRQMLFDGFATYNDVKRLDHAKRVRYFELLDVSESAALEAVRAYQDVLRYRQLVEFAEENYAQHRLVSDQLADRAKQGVSRGVDLETATGRLALAESNLLVETSNLYDVSARFQRIIGNKPDDLVANPKPLSANIPGNAIGALNNAFDKSPALRASMANVQSAQADVELRRSTFYPRVEARLERDTGRDVNGVLGHTGASVAEIAMRWNIFNGRRDISRVNQYAQLANVAKDLRDKVCRDVRQNVLIALNDVGKLREQAAFLDQHQLSTDKARQAFRSQFDIGQRTLLDLLDTENEYFQARRAYINAVHDLDTAYARLHAASGTLLAALEIAPVQPVAPPEVEAMGEDVMARCPAEAPEVAVVDKQKAIDKALRLRPPRPSAPFKAPEPGRGAPLIVPSVPSTGPSSLAPPPAPPARAPSGPPPIGPTAPPFVPAPR